MASTTSIALANTLAQPSATPEIIVEVKIPFPSDAALCNNFTFWAEYPRIEDRWNYVFHLCAADNASVVPRGRPWNACFAGHGQVFIDFLALSLVILCISLAGIWYAFQSKTGGTIHRKVLFICLLLASLVRSIYASYALHQILAGDTMPHMLHITKIMMKSLIPVMAVSDWFTGLVDFAMCLFWCTAHYNLPQFPLTWFFIVSAATFKILLMLLAYDTNYVVQNLTTGDPRWFYNNLLWYVVIMVASAAIAHVVTAVMVLRKALSTTSDVVLWTRIRAVWPMLVIVVVTIVVGVFRAMTLGGRQSGAPLFYSGDLSFNNPKFTTLYFIFSMQIPPLVVALIACTLTARSAKEEKQQHSIGDQLVLDRGSGYGSTTTGGSNMNAQQNTNNGGEQPIDDPDA